MFKAAKEGNNNMVKQLLQDTYVDPRENLYNHPEELKEFWYGTPLMLAGKFPECAIFMISSKIVLTYLSTYDFKLFPTSIQIKIFFFFCMIFVSKCF